MMIGTQPKWFGPNQNDLDGTKSFDPYAIEGHSIIQHCLKFQGFQKTEKSWWG
jgi:hypothetical protein